MIKKTTKHLGMGLWKKANRILKRKKYKEFVYNYITPLPDTIEYLVKLGCLVPCKEGEEEEDDKT